MTDVSLEKIKDETRLDHIEPTEEELHTLRKVPDRIPIAAFLVIAIELCERFTFYGLSNPLQNCIQYSPDDYIPGILGLKQKGASALNGFFYFWTYITPIIGAIIADQYWGRYWTIFWFSCLYFIGQVVLIISVLPPVVERGLSLAGIIISIIIIGLGSGGIKPNVAAFAAEQYRYPGPRVKVLSSNERVIVDHALTLQHIFLIFYLSINIGSFGGTVTIFLEKYIGYWAAFLAPACVFVVGGLILVFGRLWYSYQPPYGSVVLNSIRAIIIAIKSGFNLEKAKPSKSDGKYKIYWNDTFIDELRITLVACRIFVYYPLYHVSYIQMSTNLVSQAGTMELHGIPSELTQQINPLTLVFLIPLFDYYIYPKLRKMGVSCFPITRITMGFFFASLSMAYTAIVQAMIYNSPPCYTYPGKIEHCSAIEKQGIPNKIHVAIQIPSFIFIAISEIFSLITGLEYSYTKAPTNMKSFVLSLFLLTNTVGSLIQMLLSPLFKDPLLVWLYASISIVIFIAGCVFWLLFRKYNKLEDEMNSFQNSIKIIKEGDFSEYEKKPLETTI